MKRSETIVLFASNKAEALFAAHYQKTHPHQTVKILAPTISAQLALQDQRVVTTDYWDITYKGTKSYYDSRLKQQYLWGHALTKYFIQKFPAIETFGINLIPVLQLLIESEFIEIICAYDLFQDIRRVWKPDQYLVPKSLTTTTSSWIPSYFAEAAIMSDFFIKPTKKTFFKVPIQTPLHKPYFVELLTNTKLLIPRIGGWLYQRLPRMKQGIKQVDFLLFSGGMNLYFYHSLFRLLKQKKQSLTHTIFSAKNILEYEWLLARSSIEYEILESLMTEEREQRVQKEASQFMQKIEMIFSNNKIFKEVLPSHLPPQLQKALFHKARLVLLRYGLKCIRQTALADAALEQSKPRLVVTTHDPGPSALPFVYLAKQKKIPTLVLLHGFHDVNFGADHESDYIASWGPILKKGFIQTLGKKRHTIGNVGFPYLDELFKNRQAFWQTNTPLAFSTPVRIAFLLTVFPYNTAAISQFMRDIFESFSKNKSMVEIWLRTHPGQPLIDIEELMRRYQLNVKINESLSIEEFIRRSDIVVSWDTTAIIWALIAGKPLFYTNPWWGEGYFPIQKYKAGWVVRSIDELNKRIAKIIQNPSITYELRAGQKRFLQDVLGVIDGTSSQKLVRLIKKLVQQHRL